MNDNIPKIPERIPNALMISLEEIVYPKNLPPLEAMANTLRDYLASNECPPELKQVLGHYRFQVKPRILLFPNK